MIAGCSDGHIRVWDWVNSTLIINFKTRICIYSVLVSDMTLGDSDKYILASGTKKDIYKFNILNN